MGLLSNALAVGIGYAVAQPRVRQKLVELAHHPKVKQGREQVQDLATDGLKTAKRQLSRSSSTTDTVVADELPPTPPHVGVPPLSPLATDRVALSEGVLPPVEDVTAPETLGHS